MMEVLVWEKGEGRDGRVKVGCSYQGIRAILKQNWGGGWGFKRLC